MKLAQLLFLLLVLPLVSSANTDTLIQHRIKQAEVLRAEGHLDSAIVLLKTTRKQQLFEKAGCAERSSLYHKIGVYYYDQYKSEEALIYWRDSALQLRLTCYGEQHQETANSYYTVAMAYRDLGEQTKENDNILRSIKILEALPKKDTLDLGYKYVQVGVFYNQQGDYDHALYYLQQAQRYYEQLNIGDHINSAELFHELGVLSNQQLKHGEAIDYFKAAAGVYMRLNKKKFARNIAECYQNISKAYWKTSNFPTAEQYALRALRINQQQSATKAISINYELLGNLKKKEKDYSQALAYFQQSLTLRKQIANSRMIAYAYENIADVYAEQQLYTAALQHYQSAISYLVPDFKKTTAAAIPKIKAQLIVNQLALLRVLALKAEAHQQQYNKSGDQEALRFASSTYQSLDTLIVLIRQQYKARGSKFTLAHQSRPIYERAIETALALFESTKDQQYIKEAYLYSAKNKAIVLLDGLQDFDAKVVGVPASLLATEREIRQQHAKLENEIFRLNQATASDSLLLVLENRLFALRRNDEKLAAQLEKEHPEYYRLKYAFPDISNFEVLQQSLAANTAILEYFVGMHNIYVFVVTPQGINCFSTSKPNNFAELCQQFTGLSSGNIPYTKEAFIPIANSLFALLLQTPLQQLDESVGRLCVIPDDLLLQISFDILPFEEVKKEKAPLPYLIKKYALGSAYSGQLLSRNRPKIAHRALFAGFGVEYDDFTLAGVKAIEAFGSNPLGKLLYSDDEVNEAAALLQGDAWVNEQATKACFLEKAKNYQLLHLAMHGLVDEQQPLHSALVFSRTTDSTDYLLSAAELYALPIHADMTVLSACNTGRGQLAPGEGIRSMARAFAYAGCPSLVASLWNASDFSTKQLLLSFYQYLQAGEPKDVALRRAKLDYLASASPTHAEPAYWSHLLLSGDPRPIELVESQGGAWWWLVGGLIGSLGLFLIWRIRF